MNTTEKQRFNKLIIEISEIIKSKSDEEFNELFKDDILATFISSLGQEFIIKDEIILYHLL